MKKIIFIFFILSFMSFSTPTYNFRFKEASLLNVKLSRKTSGLRWVEGIVRNNINKKISTLEFSILYREKNSLYTKYTIVGKLQFYNLNPKERLTFSNKAILVNDINGRDFKIKLSKVIMAD